MKLRESSILLLTDMPEVLEAVQRAAGPLIKTLLHARKTSEAVSKAKNSKQAAVLLRTSQPHLSLGDNFWNWCQSDKTYKNVPWIVIDPATEPAHFFKKNPQVLTCSLAQPESIILSLERALHAGPTATELINLLVGAALEVLNAKGGVPVLRGDPFVRPAGQNMPTVGHSSQMKLEIGGRPASLLVRYPDTVLRRLKVEVSSLSQLIFAQAVEELKRKGVPVVAGDILNEQKRASEAEHAIGGPRFCVPFETGTGSILVECVVPT